MIYSSKYILVQVKIALLPTTLLHTKHSHLDKGCKRYNRLNYDWHRCDHILNDSFGN